MRCEQAREYLIAGKNNGTVTREEIDRHLADCGPCADFARSNAVLKEAADRWEDEPVPAWQPIPVMQHRTRVSTFLQWAPLATCLLLAALVLFRVELAATPGGWRVSFGSSAPTVENPSESVSREYVQTALAESQTATVGQIQTMLDRFRENQDLYLQTAFQDLAARIQNERRDDLQYIVEGWREQRTRDLESMEMQIDFLLNGQRKNMDQLFQLADYVQQQPNRQRR